MIRSRKPLQINLLEPLPLD